MQGNTGSPLILDFLWAQPDCPFEVQGCLRARYLAAIPAVLHVHPVVLVVPDTLNPKELLIGGAMAVPREGINEESFGNLSLARQNQNPCMDP